ncbi:hypothetical protein LIER_13565 [Lithospermum erythrorhizon]|uniref:Uncharacterized protein n=1 Tax=Lithospermum erythrorhizon TaxID=34254 RepID=A0AAV3PVV2_LITER
MSNPKKKKTVDIKNDEVEELLQAAHEDVFLKMNVHSHMVHASSSQIIDPDLDQRFQALKSNQNTQKHIPKNPSINKQSENHGGSDDLLGRFEALKKSLPFYENNGNLESFGGGGEEEEDEEDEVEKVIRWAKDAARLDPSPSSEDDNDNDDDGDEEESEDDYESEEENVKKGKKVFVLVLKQEEVKGRGMDDYGLPCVSLVERGGDEKRSSLPIKLHRAAFLHHRKRGPSPPPLPSFKRTK